MDIKSQNWKTPYLDKRPVNTVELLKLFPKADRRSLQALLDSSAQQDPLCWDRQQLQYVNALGWHTTDLKQKLVKIVYLYGYMKGQQNGTSSTRNNKQSLLQDSTEGNKPE